MKIKYTIEFPEKLSVVIKNLVFNYQKIYVNTAVIDRNNEKKIRLTFECTKKMKDEFIKELNEEIKNNK